MKKPTAILLLHCPDQQGIISEVTRFITDNQGNLGQNVEFVKEAATQSTVEAGHLELAKNDSHEWYGQMFWIDEETE